MSAGDPGAPPVPDWPARLHRVLSFGPFEPWARRTALFVSTGQRTIVIGSRHTPRRGPLVVAPGHAGPLDLSLIAGAVPRRLRVMVWDWYLGIPVLRSLLRLRGIEVLRHVRIGFDEENVAVLERAAARVSRGEALLVYPQGVSDRVGGGPARVAARAGAPILPLASHKLWGRRVVHRALVLIRRPLPPPGRDARSRRRTRDRLHRTLRVLGSLRAGSDRRAILDVAFDDRRLWRAPLRVLRLAARVQRLDAGAARPLARRARALLRSAARLRCSVDDLRHPPGLREFLLYLSVLPPTLLGGLLCSPVLIALVLLSRPAHILRRAVRVNAGLLAALPWGVALAVLGAILLGPVGLLLPPAALGGLLAGGQAKRLRWRVLAIPGARSGRARLERQLSSFEDHLAAATGSGLSSLTQRRKGAETG